MSVDIPAGVSTQNYITLRGQGAAGPRSGESGDLIVMIEVKEDERFTREGDDLWIELPISFSQAAIGATANVPSPWGDQQLTIPPGTQSGTVLRLRGKGLPHLGGSGVGDLNARVGVWTPRSLNDEQRRLFAALADHEAEGPEAQSGFWNKLKEALGA